jgi:hypothetical protein
MATVAVIFGFGETQFDPVPVEHGHTFRVTGINTDGARITTASVALESMGEMREALWAKSCARRDFGARAAWHEARKAAHARLADALVAFHRPSRADASANAREWLALLEAATQTPVERLLRARHAFEVRVSPVLELVVERGKIRLGEHCYAAPPTLDAALAVATQALGTDVPGLGARYALRRIAHRANDDGAVVACADAPDVLRGKRRRTIELHEHAACATCHRAIRSTAERTAVPPRGFFPRLVVCNLCPLGRAFALWDGTRLEYESHNSALRLVAASAGAGPSHGTATGEPNAVRAALEVMIAVLLAIERGASAASPLAARVRSIPVALLRAGFERLLAPFDGEY